MAVEYDNHKFDMLIEDRKNITGSYIDAITEFSEENMIDIEDIVEQISPILKEKVKWEMIKKKYVRDIDTSSNLEDI